MSSSLGCQGKREKTLFAKPANKKQKHASRRGKHGEKEDGRFVSGLAD